MKCHWKLSEVLDFAEKCVGRHTTMAEFCIPYGCSRKTGHWLLAKLEEHGWPDSPVSPDLFPGPGRPRKITSDQESTLIEDVKREEENIVGEWRRIPPNYNTHRKEARPYVTITRVREIAKGLGIVRSDSILLRLLARNGVSTAGQKSHLKRIQRLEKRHK